MLSGGSISFKITARNGTSVLAARNVSFFNFGSFNLYPNPSTNELSIDLSKEMMFDLIIHGVDSNLKAEIFRYKGGDKIDISTLPKGDYILLVIYEGKVIHQDRFVVSK
jgi:hypothetical protein